MRTWPGKSYPLGANWDGKGVNFSIFSENATSVELVIFGNSGSTERESVTLTEQTGHVWHTYIPGLLPGELYGYRIDGPYKPESGHRYNPNKLLTDPYAKAIAGRIKWDDSLFGYAVDNNGAMDERDSAPFVPKSAVIDPAYDWEGDQHPGTPWNETIIYEVHLKGFTKRNPDIDESIRGTYAGFAAQPTISYLKDLGITAVEFLPLHQHVDDRSLKDQGLFNYWGYNTIGFFAPDCRYSSANPAGGQVQEFKDMVKALHRAGIEVILDVVYNHTAEGNEMGPTLSFRGIDNISYYRLMPDDHQKYLDFTGTGNSLNMAHPRVLQLIMDSLRYWILEMHVDGFRFDLASALARELFDVDRLSAFFDIIQQDPVISQVKLIAEPWDVGEGGYQVGNFPNLWGEWNGKYRDTVRRFWRGDESQVADVGYRLTGSSDLYQSDGRKPSASINFVTAHDGFTLHDLVTYEKKLNEPNGHNNTDGTDENFNWNCGVEGETGDLDVQSLRERQRRNFMATLFLSQGVPMILGGDEIGRKQGGNNNAYCQDNEISWFDWTLSESDQSLREFTRHLIHLRAAHPVLRRKRFFQGTRLYGRGLKDITWLQPNGIEMTQKEWETSYTRTLGVLLAGDAMDEFNEKGERIADDTLLLLLNADQNSVPFVMNLHPKAAEAWEILLHTGQPNIRGRTLKGAETIDLQDHSLVLLRRT